MIDSIPYLAIISLVVVLFYAVKRILDITTKQSEFIMAVQNEQADLIVHSRQIAAEKNFEKIQNKNRVNKENIWDTAFLRGDITDEEMKRLGINAESSNPA